MSTDDRDRNPKKTPPAGVKSQLASPIEETWHEHTDLHPTPVDMPTMNDDDHQVIRGIEKRGRETKNISIDTYMGVEQLREETNDKFEKVHEKMDSMSGVVQQQGLVLSDVRAIAARSFGQNEMIIRQLDDIRDAKQKSGEIKTLKFKGEEEVSTARAKSEIEVAEALAKADIEVRKAKRTAWIDAIKQVGVKGIIAGGGVIAAAIGAGIGIERCGG